MKIIPIKTHKIKAFEEDIFLILDKYVRRMPEGSILAVTSKIISLCEGRVVKIGDVDKDELIKSEAEFFLPRKLSRYKIIFAIKNGILAPSAGIDESNADGYYVLWPRDPQKTANEIRKYLKRKFRLKKVGVIITDSKTTPLRWGTSGVAIAHSGFEALLDYIGTPDIFGRKLKMTKANIIEDLPFVKFKSSDPSKSELRDLKIELDDDLYAPMLKAVKWRKGLRPVG